jgi:hypothetical protein
MTKTSAALAYHTRLAGQSESGPTGPSTPGSPGTARVDIDFALFPIATNTRLARGKSESQSCTKMHQHQARLGIARDGPEIARNRLRHCQQHPARWVKSERAVSRCIDVHSASSYQRPARRVNSESDEARIVIDESLDPEERRDTIDDLRRRLDLQHPARRGNSESDQWHYNNTRLAGTKARGRNGGERRTGKPQHQARLGQTARVEVSVSLRRVVEQGDGT